MLKRILVPLDSSKLAETALPYAQQIIEEGGQISLLMVVERIDIFAPNENAPLLVPEVRNLAAEKEDVIQKHAQDYLTRIATEIPGTNLKVETTVQFGKPADEIVDFAENILTDIIVMSTHGRTGLSRWLLGSVTQKVLSASPCPVYIVPGKVQGDP